MTKLDVKNSLVNEVVHAKQTVHFEPRPTSVCEGDNFWRLTTRSQMTKMIDLVSTGIWQQPSLSVKAKQQQKRLDSLRFYLWLSSELAGYLRVRR